MMRYGWWMALVGAGVVAVAQDSSACGGCFAPEGSVQVVTDHRMVLALSEHQSVLWDQLQYAGNPADFSWILPIHDGANVQIALSSDLFLTVMDNLTAPYLTAPQAPTPPYCGGGDRDSLLAPQADNAGAASADAGVQVLQESVVGPYDTVTLHGTDPMALRNWLAANGYTVPAATEPVIDYYVGMQMDFIALRLRPGEGVSSMQPVRITMPDYNPVLPLRMIAAGTAVDVGLLLMVVAGSRIEAQNFPNGGVSAASLTYDFSHPTDPASDLSAAFNAQIAAGGGRTWVTESAQNLDPTQVETPLNVRSDPGAADAELAFTVAGPTAVVTRLRANLALANLDADLQLAASDGPLIARGYTYGHILHMPPPYPPCGSSSPLFGSCTAAPGSRSSTPLGYGVMLALGATVAGVRRYRRGSASNPGG